MPGPRDPTAGSGPPEFLDDRIARDWSTPKGAPRETEPSGAWSGRDARYPLEVALATAEGRPRAEDVRKLWKARHGNVPNPLLVVVAYPEGGDWKASICGPAGDEPPVEGNLEIGQVERLADAALNEPTRHAAIRFLSAMWAELETELPGLRNAGMLASHELRDGVPLRADWAALCDRGRPFLDHSGRDLVQQLGFTIEAGPTSASVLEIAETKRAVAVFLDEGEEFEQPGDRFGATSPVSYALALADREGLPWVVATRGRQIRVYSARPDIGVGRKGRAETYIEANLALLPDDRAGYLPLLFSADALVEQGTFEQVLEGSRDYAADLGARLRDRVYEHAVPTLAMVLASRDGDSLDEAALDHVYEQALTVLFRLLFVAYAEDKDLLPYRSNGAYREHALKTRARDLADRAAKGTLDFDEHSTDLWDEVATLWLAVDKGNKERGVPAYNGGLFSSDRNVSPAGADLAGVRLTNAEFGPALVAMLVDEGDNGLGPVDFRSLSVREFGTIYEGLLESSLSVALADLTLDAKSHYVPAREGDQVIVAAGAVYFHNRSGARKSTGSYFTKPFAVEHLLDHALEPALDDHLARISGLLEAGEEAKAADAFFDFRCADLAMGSGHFLVAAVDRIEARLSGFLALHAIPQVVAELDRLRAAALDALGPLGEGAEIEHTSLLRRQVARRCVYGVDLNAIAVELARLAIWIHTFVPGLPLSFLDHSLVRGNSLTGIGTLDEAVESLDPGAHESGTISYLSAEIEEVLERASGALRRLARATDASAGEIAEARAAQAEANDAVQPIRALFDLVVAARLGRAQMPTAFDEEAVLANDDLERARTLASELAALHFPVTFPEVFLRETPGFDCIVGNPPWDKVRFEPQQYWVTRDPGLNALPAGRREQRIEELRAMLPGEARVEAVQKEQRELLQELAESAYKLQGRGQHGHHDFAKLFAERALALLMPRGSLGYVLPRQCLVLGGWKDLRRAILDGNVLAVQARNKNAWLFDDVHSQYMVVFLARTASGLPTSVRIAAGVNDRARMMSLSSSDFIELSLPEIESISDTYVVPWLNEPQDRPAFEKMRALPRLGGAGWITASVVSSLWDFSGSGPHRAFASGEGLPGAWRVLMSRHVDQYRITDDPFRRVIVHPESLVPLERGVEFDSSRRVVIGPLHPCLVFRYPSMSDNTRTLLATALPEEGFLFSKGYVHGLQFAASTTTADILALLGYLNSICADWWVRRFVDRHVTKPVLVHTPLPEWKPRERTRVAELVSELLGRGGVTRLAGHRELIRNTEDESLTNDEILARLELLVRAGLGIDQVEFDGFLSDFSDGALSEGVRRELIGGNA